MNFAEIWAELERVSPPGESGRFKRRVMPEAASNLFLAVAKPANVRLIVMTVAEDSLAGLPELPVGRGVEARVVRPGDDGSDASVEVVLTDPRAADIFAALAADIATAVAPQPDEATAVTVMVGRLRRWQRFLEESGAEGLEPERQRGLFAELWLLRHHLIGALGASRAVAAWTGPQRASHDYQLGPAALEVKATAAKQPQALRISSERQLDATGVDALFVFHLSLDAHRDAGTSLPAAVDELRAVLGPALEAFEDRLFEAGYLDAHRQLYLNPGYTVREANLFRVSEGFPRIVEADLRHGVGDVHYSIEVAECRHFAVPMDAALEQLGRWSSRG